MNPEELPKKSKEQLVQRLADLNLILSDDLMAEIIEIKAELFGRLKKDKKDGEIIGEYAIRKNTKITFKTTLEQAQELGAVKTVPDSTKLRKIHDAGGKVPETNITEYLSVRRLSQDEAQA